MSDAKKNIAIIGLGLIGASFALGLKEFTDHKVFGLDIDKKTLEKALLTNAIDFILDNKNIALIDILIIALNPTATLEVLDIYSPLVKEGAVILDICGVKKPIFDKMGELAKEYPKLQFVSTHPMAGKEAWGFDFADSTLFNNASMLTIPVSIAEKNLQMLDGLFTELGFSKNIRTTAGGHDKIIAYTSQSCHAISVAFKKNSLLEKHHGFSAGSFRDLTRVAKLNSKMWTELFILNKENLSNTLDEFIGELSELNALIKLGDEKKLLAYLNEK